MRGNFHQVKHSLVLHKLTHMRRRPIDCPTRDFTNLMREIGMLMAYAVTEKWPLVDAKDNIKMEREGSIEAKTMRGNKPVIVPIVRSGLVMADGMNEVIQTTYTGHIGIHHKKNEPETVYLVNLPNKIEMETRKFIVVDPVIARGVTAVRSIQILNGFGIKSENIYFATIITSMEGLSKVAEECGKVNLYYVAIDKLRASELIPGLGSVSERLFRTD